MKKVGVMMKNKIVQMKNPQKVFKDKTFKLRGHDFLFLLDKIKDKITVLEAVNLMKADEYFRQQYGDYEVFVHVNKFNVKFVDFLE